MEKGFEYMDFEIHETKFGISLLADCIDYMATMADKSVDLCLTDPPYGIRAYANGSMGGGVLAKQSKFDATTWDESPASREQIAAITRTSKNQIIFGGNYFDLPPSSCWLVWDKDNGSNDFADCELAWTSFNTAVRLYKWKWQGMLQQDMKNKDKRIHPAQKPVALFNWCLTNYSKKGDIIFDPFAGSFTTAISCIRTGRKYLCIEKERKYFEIGIKRIDEELAQTDFLRDEALKV